MRADFTAHGRQILPCPRSSLSFRFIPSKSIVKAEWFSMRIGNNIKVRTTASSLYSRNHFLDMILFRYSGPIVFFQLKTDLEFPMSSLFHGYGGYFVEDNIFLVKANISLVLIRWEHSRENMSREKAVISLVFSSPFWSARTLLEDSCVAWFDHVGVWQLLTAFFFPRNPNPIDCIFYHIWDAHNWD